LSAERQADKDRGGKDRMLDSEPSPDEDAEARAGEALIRHAFEHVDTWVFDLDNTLYPADCDLWPKIDARITLFLAHLFGLDGMSSRALQKYYYLRYGTTLRGLMVDHQAAQSRAVMQIIIFLQSARRHAVEPEKMREE